MDYPILGLKFIPILGLFGLEGIFNILQEIGCFISSLLTNPLGFINFLLAGLIQLILSIVPSTPENLKIGTLLTAIATTNPLLWKITGEIVGTLLPMLAILLVVKAWKIFSPL